MKQTSKQTAIPRRINGEQKYDTRVASKSSQICSAPCNWEEGRLVSNHSKVHRTLYKHEIVER